MAPRQHPQPAVAQFDVGVLVEAAIFEDNAATELPVVSLIKGDKDIGPAQCVELAITLAERPVICQRSHSDTGSIHSPLARTMGLFSEAPKLI